VVWIVARGLRPSHGLTGTNPDYFLFADNPFGTRGYAGYTSIDKMPDSALASRRVLYSLQRDQDWFSQVITAYRYEPGRCASLPSLLSLLPWRLFLSILSQTLARYGA